MTDQLSINKDEETYKFVPMTEMTDKLFERCGGWVSKKLFHDELGYNFEELEHCTYPVCKSEFDDETKFDALNSDLEKNTLFICGSPKSRLYMVTVSEFFKEIS